MPALKSAKKSLRSGFTFIELALAILFVALLALTVALVSSNISKIFSKGLVVKAVDSAGSDLIEEFTVGLQSAPATQLTPICDTVFGQPGTSPRNPAAWTSCRSDRTQLFIYSQYRTDSVYYVPDSFTQRPDSQITGVFCTGKYSYVWNTGYVGNNLYSRTPGTFAPVPSATLRYRTGGNVREVEDFRLLRFEDPSRVACGSQLDQFGNSDLSLHGYHITYPVAGDEVLYDITHESTGVDYNISADPVELIPATENPLALYSLYIAPPAQDSTTNRLIYSGSFVLASLRGGADITATQDYCEIREGLADDFDYCAVNKFNFAAQATGK